jgi:hypothetical protein
MCDTGQHAVCQQLFSDWGSAVFVRSTNLQATKQYPTSEGYIAQNLC